MRLTVKRDRGAGAADGMRCNIDGDRWCGQAMGSPERDGVMVFNRHGQPAGLCAACEHARRARRLTAQRELGCRQLRGAFEGAQQGVLALGAVDRDPAVDHEEGHATDAGIARILVGLRHRLEQRALGQCRLDVGILQAGAAGDVDQRGTVGEVARVLEVGCEQRLGQRRSMAG